MILLQFLDEPAVHVLEPVALVHHDVAPHDALEGGPVVHGDLVARDDHVVHGAVDLVTAGEVKNNKINF